MPGEMFGSPIGQSQGISDYNTLMSGMATQQTTQQNAQLFPAQLQYNQAKAQEATLLANRQAAFTQALQGLSTDPSQSQGVQKLESLSKIYTAVGDVDKVAEITEKIQTMKNQIDTDTRLKVQDGILTTKANLDAMNSYRVGLKDLQYDPPTEKLANAQALYDYIKKSSPQTPIGARPRTVADVDQMAKGAETEADKLNQAYRMLALAQQKQLEDQREAARKEAASLAAANRASAQAGTNPGPNKALKDSIVAMFKTSPYKEAFAGYEGKDRDAFASWVALEAQSIRQKSPGLTRNEAVTLAMNSPYATRIRNKGQAAANSGFSLGGNKFFQDTPKFEYPGAEETSAQPPPKATKAEAPWSAKLQPVGKGLPFSADEKSIAVRTGFNYSGYFAKATAPTTQGGGGLTPAQANDEARKYLQSLGKQ